MKNLPHVHLRAASPFCGEILPTSAYNPYSSSSSLCRRYVYMPPPTQETAVPSSWLNLRDRTSRSSEVSIVSLVDKGATILAVRMNPAYADLRVRRNRCIFGISFKLD